MIRITPRAIIRVVAWIYLLSLAGCSVCAVSVRGMAEPEPRETTDLSDGGSRHSTPLKPTEPHQ